jgi:hypothetical protein
LAGTQAQPEESGFRTVDATGRFGAHGVLPLRSLNLFAYHQFSQARRHYLT